MPTDDHNDRDPGGRPRRVSDDALVHAVRDAIRSQSAPVASTSDIEARVEDLSRRGLQKRLRALRDEGILGAKEVDTSLVWWVPDATDEPDDTVRGDGGTSDTTDDARTPK